MKKFDDTGYDEKYKFENLSRYFIVNSSHKTRDLVLKHLEDRGRYKVPEGSSYWSDGALGLMGFYIESDVTDRSNFIPYAHLHLEILDLFKNPTVNFVVVYCSPNNWLFIYDRPNNSADFMLR